jgi:uncharacterized membrane protein
MNQEAFLTNVSNVMDGHNVSRPFTVFMKNQSQIQNIRSFQSVFLFLLFFLILILLKEFLAMQEVFFKMTTKTNFKSLKIDNEIAISA